MPYPMAGSSGIMEVRLVDEPDCCHWRLTKAGQPKLSILSNAQLCTCPGSDSTTRVSRAARSQGPVFHQVCTQAMACGPAKPKMPYLTTLLRPGATGLLSCAAYSKCRHDRSIARPRTGEQTKRCAALFSWGERGKTCSTADGSL